MIELVKAISLILGCLVFPPSHGIGHREADYFPVLHLRAIFERISTANAVNIPALDPSLNDTAPRIMAFEIFGQRTMVEATPRATHNLGNIPALQGKIGGYPTASTTKTCSAHVGHRGYFHLVSFNYSNGAADIPKSKRAIYVAHELFDKTVPLARIRYLYIFEHNVWTRLRPSNFVGFQHRISRVSGVFNGLTGKLNLSEYQISAYRRNEGHCDADYQSPKSPIGHLPLGAKIGLAALCLMAGLYSACYAFLNGGRIGFGPAIGYLLAGVIGIGGGVALGLSIITT
ncbi:hypothetical protein J3E64_000325 [Sphingobium sp. OAS761]|uniref:hypothetical protein n=1 Tax=Sphingobium sp. OAS761 TaxID=2817901 RepID=UPI00209EE5F8|nr:hypothetical protein [Sphingobium sp. OAS761]MCP1468658.1 hypothetical protein [Sphingobium sp. OAS761]